MDDKSCLIEAGVFMQGILGLSGWRVKDSDFYGGLGVDL